MLFTDINESLKSSSTLNSVPLLPFILNNVDPLP
jgi:hypothetical protein